VGDTADVADGKNISEGLNSMTITNCPMCEWQIPELPEPVKTCLECGADLSRWAARKKPPEQMPVEAKSSDDGWYFARQAAWYSLSAPLVAMALSGFCRDEVRRNHVSLMIVGSITNLLLLSGFILGVIALYRTRKCGREGIFGKAIVGVCINGLFIALILISIQFLTKRYIELTNERQKQRTIQRPW
jgi:hypothetical protein